MMTSSESYQNEIMEMMPLLHHIARIRTCKSMSATRIFMLVFCILSAPCHNILAQNHDVSGCSECIGQELLKEDFRQFREILENEHCCIYEYTSKAEMDSLFDAHDRMIDHDMKYEEFFRILAPITAKIGCMHTATWMPGRFFNTTPGKMFPLTLTLIEQRAVVTGSYLENIEVPIGSVILEINGIPMDAIIEQLRETTSADAFNPYFIDAQLIRRFSMFYTSNYGLSDRYELKYNPPGSRISKFRTLSPATIDSVRKVVFAHFNHPPLKFEVDEEDNTALMTVPTFIYYDRVDYFRNFMDSCFLLIEEKEIKNLILDLRGNGGGDPFCAVILFSYLQKGPSPYFAEPYGKYATLAEPVSMPENHFKGNLYTLLDGSCGSTNGHFCALLKYHGIGKFVGTPGGATFKCNAGKDTEFRLEHSDMILTIGRDTYSAAVKNMDKTAPIMPDVLVDVTYRDFLDHRDPFIEKAMEHIASATQ
jgi:hypothetical protein